MGQWGCLGEWILSNINSVILPHLPCEICRANLSRFPIKFSQFQSILVKAQTILVSVSFKQVVHDKNARIYCQHENNTQPNVLLGPISWDTFCFSWARHWILQKSPCLNPLVFVPDQRWASTQATRDGGCHDSGDYLPLVSLQSGPRKPLCCDLLCPVQKQSLLSRKVHLKYVPKSPPKPIYEEKVGKHLQDCCNPARHLQDSPGPTGPGIVSKQSPGVFRPWGPKSVRTVSKQSPESQKQSILRLHRLFWALFGLRAGRPRETVWRLFRDSGPRGPGRLL